MPIYVYYRLKRKTKYNYITYMKPHFSKHEITLRLLAITKL